MALSPMHRARRSAEAMWAEDGASKWLGMRIEKIEEARAVLLLDVQSHHCNGHGMCHGGIIFSLADSAFAFACNSRNQRSVAQHNVISYIAPGRLGDTLRAEAHEVSFAGRSGIYDVTVTNQDQTRIAEFRGMSRVIKGQLFDEGDR